MASLADPAALFDDDEARKRIDATNQRLTQVQKQLDDRIAALEAQLKSQGLVELFSQVEQLKADVAKLRGQIEVLTYEQEQQQKRQRDLYVDLDSRLRKLEGGPGQTATGGDAPPPVAAAVPAQPVPGAAATTEQKAAGKCHHFFLKSAMESQSAEPMIPVAAKWKKFAVRKRANAFEGSAWRK